MTDNTTRPLFLSGVPEGLVRTRLSLAGGNEIASGKFTSPDSSAALAVNGFGWFMESGRAALLPPFPVLAGLDWPAMQVEIERQMRFPWRGGRHPWLDAAVETNSHLIGVESKRFEPFRSAKAAHLSEAYDRDCWGEGMEPWCAMRDALRADPARYRHLDAAQLVKHAFGLATEGRTIGKVPVLLYLFAEPARIDPKALADHRLEIADLAKAVAGARVRFAAQSWREWLETWRGLPAVHGHRVKEEFAP